MKQFNKIGEEDIPQLENKNQIIPEEQDYNKYFPLKHLPAIGFKEARIESNLEIVYEHAKSGVKLISSRNSLDNYGNGKLYLEIHPDSDAVFINVTGYYLNLEQLINAICEYANGN